MSIVQRKNISTKNSDPYFTYFRGMKNWVYTFLLILTTIVWGTTFLIVKDTVGTVNEYMLVFIRNFLAAVPMLIYTLIKDRKNLLNTKALVQGAIIGLLLATTYVAQTIGLKYTSTGHSAFITGSAVILVPFILFAFYKAKINSITLLSTSVTLVGLFLLTYDFETQVNIGDIITIIVVAAYAMHIVLAGRFVAKVPVMPLITYQFLFSALFSLIGFIAVGMPESEFSPKAIGALVYLGIFGTLFCYFVSVWVQKFVSSVKVALIFSLEPVFAAGFGFWIINETLNLKEMIGMIIILLGVGLYQYFDNKRIAREEKSITA